MIKQFSEDEMLRIWRDRAGYADARCDCVVEYVDGVDNDRRLLADIRRWYADLLLNAPVDLLPTENLATEATVTKISDHSARIDLPSRGVRLLGLRFKGEEQEVTTFYSPGSRVERRYSDPSVRMYSRQIAIAYGRSVEVVGGKCDELLSLRMVANPKDGAFVFDESLLPRLIDMEL